MASKVQADWRVQTMSRVRAIIQEAVPEVVEEIKWRKATNPGGVPVWYSDGMICTGETYKDHLKFTFPNGGALKDSAGLFLENVSGSSRRAIDLHEADKINEKALKALFRDAAAFNAAAAKRKGTAKGGR